MEESPDTDIESLLYEIEQLQKEIYDITFLKDFMRVWTLVYTAILCKASYLMYNQRSSTFHTAIHLLLIPYGIALLEQIYSSSNIFHS